MSTTVDLSFVAQFEREVHEVFQRMGSFLLQTIRRKPNVVGATTTFQKVGKGTATTKARHGQITPMNQDHTPILCTMEDFYAGDWVDKLDELKVNHDERQVIANGGAWALGRKADDQVLTAMDGTAVVLAGGHVAITRARFLEWVETLDSNDVPNDDGRWGLLTPRQWAIAMTIPAFADADFVADKPFMVGAKPRTWMGVHWMVHTGLPGVGTATSKGFIYHTSALGFGSGAGITSDITWHGDRAAHFVNNMMSGGACLIDDTGVIEGQFDDTATIPA